MISFCCQLTILAEWFNECATATFMPCLGAFQNQFTSRAAGKSRKKDIQNQWPGWNNWKLRFVLVLCTNCVSLLCSLDNFKKFQAWVINSSFSLDISRNSSSRIEKLSITATLKNSRTPGKKWNGRWYQTQHVSHHLMSNVVYLLFGIVRINDA